MAQDIQQHEDGHQVRMGFLEHLVELRDRSLRALIALVIGTAIGFVMADWVLGVLQQPFCALVESAEQCRFQILDPTGNVMVYFRVSLLVGGIISIPFITYQAMMFIIPGLTRKEKLIVLASIPAITGLFLIGVLFAWRILTPAALDFLNGFMSNRFTTDWTADGYLGFVTSLVFWMGVAFEAPLVFFILSIVGVVTAKALVENWRIAIVGSSILAALITPTIDPVNMFLVMGPLLILYAVSIILVFFGARIGTGGAAN